MIHDVQEGVWESRMEDIHHVHAMVQMAEATPRPTFLTLFWKKDCLPTVHICKACMKSLLGSRTSLIM